MIRKTGVFVFPNEDKIKQFVFDGTDVIEYPETTYAAQLNDFLDMDLQHYRNLVDELKSESANDEFGYVSHIGSNILRTAITVAAGFADDKIYSYLMCMELDPLFMDAYVWDQEFYWKTHPAVFNILESVFVMQDMLSQFVYRYCTAEGTHAEKTHQMSIQRNDIYSHSFQEFLTVTKPCEKIFHYSFFSYPLTRGYYFDSLTNYLWFIFVNSLTFDVNFSLCKYCGRFFIPKTKRRTLYCDRIRTPDGHTCKDLAPAFFQKMKAQVSTVLREFQQARNRNFKRVERFEDKLSDEKLGKDLDYQEYHRWLQQTQDLMQQWQTGKIDEETVLHGIHILD